MKNKRILSLLIITFLIKYAESSGCSNTFQTDLQSFCENHVINTTHGCTFSKGLCISTFSSCSSYTGEDKTKCESIVLPDKLKKCKLNGKYCTEVKKGCADYDSSGDISCSSLYAGVSQNCVLVNDKCKAHYDKCEDFTTGVDETKCKANIPLEQKNKCVWDSANSACKEVLRECKDYFNAHYSNCEALATSDVNKVCITSSKGDFCEEQYKTCELYDTNEGSKNKANCEKIKTYSDTSKNFDNTKICSFSGETCSTQNKKCEDITSSYECNNFRPSDSNTLCIYNEDKCKTQYKTCYLYNTYVSDKSKDECESIKYYDTYHFDNSYKCVYKDGTCTKTKRDCSEFTYEYDCKNQRPEDYSTKKCVFLNNKCEEQFKTCELYNEETTKTKEICEKILPDTTQYSGTLDYYSKCVYTESGCERKKKSCSELDSSHCNEANLDDIDKMCVYENNECKEVYKSCSSYNNYPNKSEQGCKALKLYKKSSYYNSVSVYYDRICIYEDNTCKEKYLSKCNDYESWMGEKYCNGIEMTSYKGCALKNNVCVTNYTECPGDKEKVTEEVCNAINPSLEYMKCVLDEDENCVQIQRDCSEYEFGSGPDDYRALFEFACNFYYKPADETKRCFLENGKCVAKPAGCSKYEGNDKATCESIIPISEFWGSSLQETHKCVLDEDNVCTMIKKGCNEAKTEYECSQFEPPNSDKECIYLNGECKEQYKNCDNYNNNGEEEVNQNVCESIVMKDSSYKCIFDTSNKKCIQKKKDCSDLNKNDFYSEICSSISLSSLAKKCTYDNSACSEVNKSCLELKEQSGVTEEICLAASTSNSNKVCIINESGAGCLETEKNSNQNNGNTDNNNNSKKNNGCFIKMIKFSLLLIIFELLF